MSRPSQRFRVSFRREILILLPVAFLLPLLLATFVLFSYRNAVGQWLAQRQDQALAGASRVAEAVSAAGPPSSRRLRQAAPGAQWIAVLDGAGLRRVQAGAPPAIDAAPTELTRPGEPRVLSIRDAPGHVVAVAPAQWNDDSYYAVVALAGEGLNRQRESLRVLSWVVLATSGALALLTFFFLRHVVAPYDTLLARARQALPGGEDPADEVGFLVASFEKGLEALRKRTEADEVATVERLLGPSLASGLLLIGHDGDVLAVNELGARLLGLRDPELPRPLADLLASYPELHRLIAVAVGEERSINRREIQIDVEGEPRALGLGVHPLRREDGPPRAFLALFADLTESNVKAREENLATSLAQVGEMAAGVAHEMRNGLATIRGYLTLAERGPDDESLADYLADLRRESDHLQRVLEDFLTFARPGSTRLERLDLAAVAHRATADPALAGLAIRVDAEAGTSIINGDRQLLERAVRNLLENAAQAQQAAGAEQPLRVDLECDGRSARLSIRDRGTGIPGELRDKIFQPFVTGREGGIGLGLALAHRIVALHGGTLRLADREDGGTRAVLSLPLAETG